MTESVSERDRKKRRISGATAVLREQTSGSAITARERATLQKFIASGAAISLAAFRRARQEPLSPRGKPQGGSGVRIPVRSQQSIAKAMDRRRARKRAN